MCELFFVLKKLKPFRMKDHSVFWFVAGHKSEHPLKWGSVKVETKEVIIFYSIRQKVYIHT